MAPVEITPARRPLQRRSYSGADNPNYRGGSASPCARCSALVWVRPSRASARRNFCSLACRNAWMAENTTGPDHWRFQGGPVARTCKSCLGRFRQPRKAFNQSPGVYCSRACQSIGRRRRVAAVCESCLADFEVRAHAAASARFCSRDCKRISQVKDRSPRELARLLTNKRFTVLMWDSLRHRKAGRKWESLVGYTLADLMRHLESLFQPGMTWENMGRRGWHIDHIRPRSSFDYADADDPQFLECWGLANLQPLWEIDNLRKGAKYDPPPDRPQAVTI